jgi:malonate transporter
MSSVLISLCPIFLLIILGYFIRQKALLAENFWLPAEKINYFLFFPALMVMQVAKADLTKFAVGPIAVSLLGAVAITVLILLGMRLLTKQSGPVFSSVLQGSLRPNTYVGVAAASALYGNLGITITSISIAVTIPLLNVFSILILLRYGDGNRTSPLAILKTLIKNPVISAVIAGLLINISGLALPAVFVSFLAILGSASLPLGLLVVGAGLDIRAAKAAHGPVLQSSIAKLVIVPALTMYIGTMLGITGPTLVVIILFNSLPCTPSAYIMARLMGGDHRLAAGIITIQTALAAITIPLILIFSNH